MTRLVAIALLAAAVLTGCGKSKGGDGCPAGEITLDGEPLANTHGVAVEGQGSYVIMLYDHDKVTCEEMLTTQVAEIMELAKARGKQNDEIQVRVATGGLGNAIGLGGNTKMDSSVKAELVAKPAKVGDRTAICLTEPAEYDLQIGPHKGKKLVMKGLFEGEFCGSRE